MFKKKESEEKKSYEFSQMIVCIAFFFSMAIVVVTVGLNFFLILINKMPMTQEVVTAITVYGGVTSGVSFTAYAALQGWRNNSENKYCQGDWESKG